VRTFLNGTWLYSKGSEFKGRTDNYTLDLYRGKGYVLDKKYLDPQLWHELEYGIPSPRMTVEPPQPPRSTLNLKLTIVLSAHSLYAAAGGMRWG